MFGTNNSAISRRLISCPIYNISGDRSIISICLVRSGLGFASLHCFAIKRILGIIQGFVFYLVDVKPSKCDPKLVLESVFDLCGCEML